MSEQVAKSALELFLEGEGYQHIRTLPDGRLIGLYPFAFTWGLVVGMDAYGYESRYCYEHYKDAHVAAVVWDGAGDPPGPWIKHKGAPGGDRLNPAWSRDEV